MAGFKGIILAPHQGRTRAKGSALKLGLSRWSLRAVASLRDMSAGLGRAELAAAHRR